MPSVPKWLADTMEKVAQKSFHPVTVTHIHKYHPKLKLVRFEGDIQVKEFKAGNVIEFRVSDREYRHYTPSLYDPVKQICEVIFYLHDKGPGSEWAEKLQIGDQLKLMGPGGKMSYQPEWKNHLVFGDETSLGLMLSMEQAVLKNGQHFTGIAELEKQHLDWVDSFGSSNIKAVESSIEYPAIRLTGFEADLYETCFYLTGRAKSIQEFRKELLAKGVNSKQIKTYPYWAEGKKGL
ncbi:NADPH-dependent ferric-chelate reductase [compost metagenome]